jgi:hypothetical protein
MQRREQRHTDSVGRLRRQTSQRLACAAREVRSAEGEVRGRNRASRRCAMSWAMTDSRQPRARRSAARCPSDSAIASCGGGTTTRCQFHYSLLVKVPFTAVQRPLLL